MKYTLRALFALFCVLICGQAVYALGPDNSRAVSPRTETVTIPISQLGWYTNTGIHDSTNINTLTGYLDPADEYRSFFIWDLSSIKGHKVIAAQMQVLMEYSLGALQYNQTANIYDVSQTSLSTIGLDNGGGYGLEIFDDLGSGTSYGSIEVQPYTTQMLVSYPLNIYAVRAINKARGGEFALGLMNTSFETTGGYGYFLFSSESMAGEQNLVLTITR